MCKQNKSSNPAQSTPAACVHCGEPLPAEAEACPKCGTKIQEIPDLSVFARLPIGMQYLTTVYNAMHRDIIISVLQQEHIPVLVKYPDGGDYLLAKMGGAAQTRMDLYVNGYDYETAKILLTPVSGGQQSPDDIDPES